MVHHPHVINTVAADIIVSNSTSDSSGISFEDTVYISTVLKLQKSMEQSKKSCGAILQQQQQQMTTNKKNEVFTWYN